jgi:hypothetical protein
MESARRLPSALRLFDAPLIKKGVRFLYLLIAFAIPIEHKYYKPLRFFSKAVVPSGFKVPDFYHKWIYFYPSDLLAPLICLLLGYAGCLSWRRHKEMVCLWIVVACALFSLFFSPMAHYPVPYFRLLELATPFLLCFSLAQIGDEPLAKRIFYALLAGALLQGAIAIGQYIFQEPLGLRLLGEQRFSVHSPTTPRVPVDSRWALDRFFGYPHSHIIRVPGTFTSPNVLGGLLFLSIMGTYYLLVSIDGVQPLRAAIGQRGQKIFLKLALLVQIVVLALTFSRAALFAWWMGSAIFLLGVGKRGWRAIGGVLALALILLALLFGEQYLKRGGVFSSTPLTERADASRRFYHHLAYEMIKRAPLLGVGYQQFSYRSPEFADPEAPSDLLRGAVHNIYLFLGAETGLISLCAFIAFFAALLRRALSCLHDPLTAALAAIVSGFLFIGGCDFYPLCSHQGMLMLFLPSALLSSRLKNFSQSSRGPRMQQRHASPI